MTVARFYLRNCLIGFGLSALFTAILLWQDVGGIGHLVTHVSGGWLAALMLWIFNGIVFAPVQFCVALWLRAESDTEDGPRGPKAPVADPAMVAITR